MNEFIAIIAISLCFVGFIPASVVICEVGFRITDWVLEALRLE